MNILIFSWRDPKHPLAGGAEQVVLEHAKGWVRAGHNVTWFASFQKGLNRTENLDGINIVRNGYQYLGVQLSGFIYYFRNRKNIDFIVDQFHGIPFFTPLYVAKPRLALIQEVAKKVWFLNPLPWPVNKLVGLIGYILEPLILRLYKKIHFMTASESAKRDIKAMGIPESDITLIPHGVVLPKEMPKVEKEKTKTITYLGIISKDKGVEDAIKCFEILKGRGNFRFWVIGRSENQNYERHVKNLARPLGNRVKFWGHVSQKEKFNLLARSHVLINPSVHEGWGLVNIEANSVGTPVVAYKSAGLIDSVKDGKSGIIVSKNTPERLAQTINKMLTDVKKYIKLCDGAVLWSRNFCWKKSRKQSLDLLRKIYIHRNAK